MMLRTADQTINRTPLNHKEEEIGCALIASKAGVQFE
jgi:hypothetical protein